jgi:hypothetical protein
MTLLKLNSASGERIIVQNLRLTPANRYESLPIDQNLVETTANIIVINPVDFRS